MKEGLDLLVVAAHPDDAEIGAGGLMAKYAAAGLRVGVVDLTQAEMSSNGTPEIRQAESERASSVLGLAVRVNLGLPDRTFAREPEAIDRLVRAIRELRPRVVLAPHWDDRHPDHVACSRITEEAVFSAKLRRYLPDVEPFEVGRLYFYFINGWAHPDIAVDVTDVYEIKRRALRCYESQFTPPGTDGRYVATPLNTGYLDFVETRDRSVGRLISAEYAEGFAAKGPVRVERL
ncbi:MAG: bacillithiol biosynthesis deacetylase BshB1 [Candidatus Reconcilbacillus cellulovorans]|uniref:Bacillithiol biosynthesis deacetylase BshB1 n=1 Tax=Candidatus Reconcilbacillus cellulovorans TaxID=1906605 RepID=A0A2A6E3W7_9BACL|nr:MAG: bacillithiol biosynthesis deacetylase BshB1 [Candidatus Reconcilbacillus cellulovorans]